MKIHYISHSFSCPRTGGEKYNHLFINLIKEYNLDLEIHIDRDIPYLYKRNYFFYNYWYMKHLDYYKNSLIIIDSYLHPRLFIFLKILKKRYPKTKIYSIHHHFNFLCEANFFRKLADMFVEKSFLKTCTKVIIPSPYTRDMFVKLLPHSCFEYIELGFNLPKDKKIRSTKETNSLNLIFVGTIYKRKGIILLIKALKYIKNMNFTLNIVGTYDKNNKYYRKVIKLVKRFKLQNKVNFLGRLSDKDLMERYKYSDIFVFPSLYEGLGIVLAEAMSFGLPIIAFDNSAMPYIVKDGYNGILVPNKNTKKMSEAIQKLLQDNLLRAKFSFNSYEYSLHFRTYEDMVKSMKNFILNDIKFQCLVTL
jgi:glycosyltransferase involved in cell wall biosynthesis